MMGYGMMGGWGGSGGLGILGGLNMVLMGIVPLLVLGALVWFVVELVRRGSGHGVLAAPPTITASSTIPAGAEGHSGRVSPARTLLDERYARGELDRETYLQMRRDLDTA